MFAIDATDEQLWAVCKKLPSDYEPYGQRKWQGEREAQPDCATCCWFVEISRSWPEWGNCANPQSPRAGLLTHWEQGCEQVFPQKGGPDEQSLNARLDFRNSVESRVREEASDFMCNAVERENGAFVDGGCLARRWDEMREAAFGARLRELFKKPDADLRRETLDGIVATVKWESGRYWAYARRFWAREFGEVVLAIRMPENMAELEEEFWGRVDAIFREAHALPRIEPEGNVTQR